MPKKKKAAKKLRKLEKQQTKAEAGRLSIVSAALALSNQRFDGIIRRIKEKEAASNLPPLVDVQLPGIY